MKRKLIVALLACIILSCGVGAGFSAFAQEPSAERELLFSDDCKNVDSANIFERDPNLWVDAHGYKVSNASQAYIVFQAEKDIGEIELRVWHTDGYDGFTYGLAAKNINVEVFVSGDGRDFTAAPYTYAADTSDAQDGDGNIGKFIVLTAENISEGNRYFKVAITTSDGFWWPQLSKATAYGRTGGDPVEEPVFHDPCTDLLEAVSFDSNLKNDPRGITRTDSNPGAVVYDAGQPVGRVELILNVQGGYDAWIFNEARDFYNIRIFAGESKNGPFAEIGYEVSRESAVSGDWGLVKAVSENISAETRYVKLLLDAPKSSWHVCIREVYLYEKTSETPVIASVTITSEGRELISGGSLAFSAETDPAGAIVYFEAYDDENLSKPSEFARFDGNILTSDYDGLEDIEIYVVARSGDKASAAEKVTIRRRPDAESVSFVPSAVSFTAGETIYLVSSVLPAGAINTQVEYAAYLDGELTRKAEGVLFEGDTMFLADDFAEKEFYVVARVMKSDGTYIVSGAVRFTVKYKEIIFNDPCADLDKIDKELSDVSMFGTEKGFIRRFFPEMVSDPQYAALGAGSRRTDKAKYDVPSVVYHVNTDINSFSVSAIVYDAGNKAMTEANKNDFIGLVNIYVSETGNSGSWTYVKTDFTASLDVGSLESGAYTKLNLFNVEPLAAGMKYIRIDLLGQISKRETNNGGSYEYEGASGVTPEEDYGDIVLFYNSYSPFLAGVSLYAAEGAPVAPEIVRIYGEEGMSVRAGDENGLTLQMYKEFSNAPGTAVAFTAEELSASEYEIEQGGEYVTVESGVVKVKAGYDASGMREVKIRVKLNDITSEVIVVKIIIPVKTVTISAEKTQIEVGDTLKLSATVTPGNASLTAVDWYIAEGEGTVSADGTFTAAAAGVIKIKAVADGAESELFTITVLEKKAAETGGTDKNSGCKGSVGAAEGLTAFVILLSVTALLFTGKKRV